MQILRKRINFGHVSLLAIALFILPFMLIACDSGTDQADVREETKEAVEAMQNYAQDKREEYRDAVQNRLNEIKTQIQELRERTASLQKDVGQELQASIDSLDQNYENLKQNFAKMENSEQAEWDSVQAELNQALNGLEKAYQDAAAQLRAQDADMNNAVRGYKAKDTQPDTSNQ